MFSVVPVQYAVILQYNFVYESLRKTISRSKVLQVDSMY